MTLSPDNHPTINELGDQLCAVNDQIRETSTRYAAAATVANLERNHLEELMAEKRRIQQAVDYVVELLKVSREVRR